MPGRCGPLCFTIPLTVLSCPFCPQHPRVRHPVRVPADHPTVRCKEVRGHAQTMYPILPLNLVLNKFTGILY